MKIRALLHSLCVLFLLPVGALAQDAAKDLQVKELVAGDGAEAVEHALVKVHYTGWLMDGTKFDSSVDRGKPFTFTLGLGEVIPGWDQGVQGMRVGGKRELIVPPQLAYGKRGAGDTIPPNSTLKFEVELLGVQEPPFKSAGAAQVQGLQADGAKLIDIRLQSEWSETGVIDGALLLPAFQSSGRFNQKFPKALAGAVKKSEPLVVVGASGDRRSVVIANALAQRAGYESVYHLKGGIGAWTDAGQGLVTAPAPKAAE